MAVPLPSTSQKPPMAGLPPAQGGKVYPHPPFVSTVSTTSHTATPGAVKSNTHTTIRFDPSTVNPLLPPHPRPPPHHTAVLANAAYPGIVTPAGRPPLVRPAGGMMPIPPTPTAAGPIKSHPVHTSHQQQQMPGYPQPGFLDDHRIMQPSPSHGYFMPSRYPFHPGVTLGPRGSLSPPALMGTMPSMSTINNKPPPAAAATPTATASNNVYTPPAVRGPLSHLPPAVSTGAGVGMGVGVGTATGVHMGAGGIRPPLSPYVSYLRPIRPPAPAVSGAVSGPGGYVRDSGVGGGVGGGIGGAYGGVVGVGAGPVPPGGFNPISFKQEHVRMEPSLRAIQRDISKLSGEVERERALNTQLQQQVFQHQRALQGHQGMVQVPTQQQQQHHVPPDVGQILVEGGVAGNYFDHYLTLFIMDNPNIAIQIKKLNEGAYTINGYPVRMEFDAENREIIFDGQEWKPFLVGVAALVGAGGSGHDDESPPPAPKRGAAKSRGGAKAKAGRKTAPSRSAAAAPKPKPKAKQAKAKPKAGGRK
ncbi:unnamed protein product [Vitrella brassicaformis CCMP3155]|uniref:Uncharacterized protein n=2 Tax=Vitrella brassicaformis TaxID=1169539 RepID=A0A0G4H790_VITBC|nr:unnamed protein product [Vitrella brassicaformis CCMP3155]|eukprot:CEM39506.1 unnamed protein product [Vitrella brassicaformis CCMP3155]